MKRVGLIALLLVVFVAVAWLIIFGIPSSNPVVVVDTSMGTIKIELYQDRAPISVANFLKYVDDRFYDGTIFHRVISDFMIQGGGFDSAGIRKGREKPTFAPIKNESTNLIANNRGTVAMARTEDPNSATAQFFINTKDNSFLNKANAADRVGYAVFGRVIEGMDVVDKIRNVETLPRGPLKDAPLNDVVIKSIRRATNE